MTLPKELFDEAGASEKSVTRGLGAQEGCECECVIAPPRIITTCHRPPGSDNNPDSFAKTPKSRQHA